MDDFGAGYSSLNILQDLDIDILKLDRKIISKIGADDKKSNNILKAVVGMAHSLNMTVIAEGVETQRQADYLNSVGCEIMQGYYYAKPMPINEFEKMIINKNRIKHGGKMYEE